MSGSYRDDRPALVVLALLVASIIVVAFLGVYARHEANYQVGCYAASEIDQNGIQQDHSVCPDDHLLFGDGLAQWMMALFAVVATGASLYGIRLLRDTFKETKRTADAALAANTINQEALYASHRPYLVIEKVDLAGHQEEGSVFWWANVQVKNLSTIPALDVSCVAIFVKGINAEWGSALAARLATNFDKLFHDGTTTIVHPTGTGSVKDTQTLMHLFDSANFPDSVSALGWSMAVCVRYRSAVGPKHYFVGAKYVIGKTLAGQFANWEVSSVEGLEWNGSAYAT